MLSSCLNPLRLLLIFVWLRQQALCHGLVIIVDACFCGVCSFLKQNIFDPSRSWEIEIAKERWISVEDVDEVRTMKLTSLR